MSLTFEGMQLDNQVKDALDKAKTTGEVHYVTWENDHFETVEGVRSFRDIEVRVYPGGRMEALGQRAKRIAAENKGRSW